MIKLQCIGHLGKDAAVNQVNGKTVINFNVAHSEKYKDANGIEINKTIWVSCGYWSDKTTIAQYLLKGTLVYVEGTPDIKTYKDNQGATNANITLRVNNIQLLSSKKEDRSGSSLINGTNGLDVNLDVVDPLPGRQINSDISTENESDLPF